MIILYAHFSKPPEKLANGVYVHVSPSPKKRKEEEEEVEEKDR